MFLPHTPSICQKEEEDPAGPKQETEEAAGCVTFRGRAWKAPAQRAGAGPGPWRGTRGFSLSSASPLGFPLRKGLASKEALPFCLAGQPDRGLKPRASLSAAPRRGQAGAAAGLAVPRSPARRYCRGLPLPGASGGSPSGSRSLPSGPLPAAPLRTRRPAPNPCRLLGYPPQTAPLHLRPRSGPFLLQKGPRLPWGEPLQTPARNSDSDFRLTRTAADYFSHQTNKTSREARKLPALSL